MGSYSVKGQPNYTCVLVDLCIMIIGTDKDLVRPVVSYTEQYI